MGSTLLLLVVTFQRVKSSYDKSPMSVLHATTSAPKLLTHPYFTAWPFDPTHNPYRAWNTELAFTRSDVYKQVEKMEDKMNFKKLKKDLLHVVLITEKKTKWDIDNV